MPRLKNAKTSADKPHLLAYLKHTSGFKHRIEGFKICPPSGSSNG